MSIHIATLNDRPVSVAERTEATASETIVKRMADHLVAAILHGGLDTSSDVDVIECLRNAPDRYHYRAVLDHMDAAMIEAKQILVAYEMSRS